MKKTLIAVLILGAVLRLAGLGSVPVGFFRDEAAIGYNAYSIWKTGADEFGIKAPLVFRSFEVFFLPLYIYLTAPVVGILGTTVFASRLISSLSGILAIYLVYLIGKRLWGSKVGVVSAFILAISPWHIFYSRGTFEGNLALTLFVAGFYFWLEFTKNYSPKKFLFSMIFFCLSMYSYQAERLVVPLFGLAALIISFKKIWEIRKSLVLPILISFIIMIPLLSLSFKPGGYHRALGVSIFSQEKYPSGWNHGEDGSFFINNSFYLRAKEIASLYLSYYSPRNLFVEGDANKQRSVVGFSVFYSYMIVGLILGIYKLFNKPTQNEKLLFFWLVLAPIPAALTGDPFHTYRSLLFYVPLVLIIGCGFSVLLKDKTAHWLLFIFVSIGFLSTFIFNYVYINTSSRSHDWDYGYKQIVEFTKSLPQGSRVIVDDPWTEAYIHFLYFGGIDPVQYQKEVATLGDPNAYYYTNSDEIRPGRLGIFEFRKVDWPSERGTKGTIFIMWAEILPDSEYKTDPKIQLLKEILYPDGKVAFKIVKVI